MASIVYLRRRYHTPGRYVSGTAESWSRSKLWWCRTRKMCTDSDFENYYDLYEEYFLDNLRLTVIFSEVFLLNGYKS